MIEERFQLRSARWIAADYLERHLKPGDRAIDATMGNGKDTERLCQLVGDTGRVYAFDVQDQAISSTRCRLTQEGLIGRAVLIRDGHEHMEEYIREPVQAVVFNLGWLPGGDHAVTTKTATTERAVDAALRILCPGGILSVCVYPGHEEGEKELRMLVPKFERLDVRCFAVLYHRFLNASDDAPRLFLIQKIRTNTEL